MSLCELFGIKFLRGIWHIGTHFLSERSEGFRAPLRPFDKLFCYLPPSLDLEHSPHLRSKHGSNVSAGDSVDRIARSLRFLRPAKTDLRVRQKCDGTRESAPKASLAQSRKSDSETKPLSRCGIASFAARVSLSGLIRTVVSNPVQYASRVI
jgi:hypothetical protein